MLPVRAQGNGYIGKAIAQGWDSRSPAIQTLPPSATVNLATCEGVPIPMHCPGLGRCFPNLVLLFRRLYPDGADLVLGNFGVGVVDCVGQEVGRRFL